MLLSIKKYFGDNSDHFGDKFVKLGRLVSDFSQHSSCSRRPQYLRDYRGAIHGRRAQQFDVGKCHNI